MYFMVQWCLHIVIHFLWPPKSVQNMLYFVPLSPVSTEFRKILRKHRNSMETSKFCGRAQNSAFCGKLWSVVICVVVVVVAAAAVAVATQHHMSCLTWAAGRGHTEIVRELIHYNAKVTTADKVTDNNLFLSLVLSGHQHQHLKLLKFAHLYP